MRKQNKREFFGVVFWRYLSIFLGCPGGKTKKNPNLSLQTPKKILFLQGFKISAKPFFFTHFQNIFFLPNDSRGKLYFVSFFFRRGRFLTEFYFFLNFCSQCFLIVLKKREGEIIFGKRGALSVRGAGRNQIPGGGAGWGRVGLAAGCFSFYRLFTFYRCFLCFL